MRFINFIGYLYMYGWLHALRVSKNLTRCFHVVIPQRSAVSTRYLSLIEFATVVGVCKNHVNLFFVPY